MGNARLSTEATGNTGFLRFRDPWNDDEVRDRRSADGSAMPDLLLELFSEEIPARMQARAAEDLQRLVGDGLKAAGLTFARSEADSGPRRLVLHVEELSARSADIREERKGPRVGAPEKAIEGFLRGAGIRNLDGCETRDDGKGPFYVAIIEKPGRPASAIIAEIVPEVIRKFPWPKSMRWGSSRLRWVRPLHSILCMLGGEVVPFEVDGIESGRTTRGHRRALDPALRGKSLSVENFADYSARSKRRTSSSRARGAWRPF